MFSDYLSRYIFISKSIKNKEEQYEMRKQDLERFTRTRYIVGKRDRLKKAHKLTNKWVGEQTKRGKTT